VLNSFALTYTNNNRKALLKEFKDATSFQKGFDAEPMLEELKRYTASEDPEIVWDEAQFSISKSMIQGRAMALIARNLWDYSAYYQVFNPYWPSYKSAIDIIQNGKYANYNLAESGF
jgi:hypothetical protein